MVIKSLTLGALVGARAAVALAAPGIVPIFPIRNVTKPTPTTEPTDSPCAAQCSVEYPKLTAVQWIPESQIIYTTKITVATYRHIIVTAGNRTIDTRTDLVFGYVASEYDLYRVTLDGLGTAVVNVPITHSDGVTFSQFTYPTPYIDYTTEYHWQGVLQTYDKDFSPACATAAPKFANVPLLHHPEYPQPKDLGAGKVDSYGVKHRPVWGPVKAEPDALFFQVAFPSEAAFSYCESISAEVPLPTVYEAAMFVTTTETVWSAVTTEGIVKIMSSVTGFEQVSTADRTLMPAFPHLESTASGFPEVVQTTTIAVSSPKMHLESTGSGFGDAQQTERPELTNSPGFNPETVFRPTLPTPTPILTFVPTVINGQTTTVPAYIVPGSPGTATIGQTITFNGHATILEPPPPIFTLVPTIINGVATSVSIYIISGSITATIGQTVILDGQSTVLSPPASLYTTISTTINGIPTSIPVYIISGTLTATLGQSITLNGQPTVLSAPSAVFTMLATTVNGVETTVSAYVISGSVTATAGQTVTISGTTTVISFPTNTGDVNTGLGQPIATPAAGAPATSLGSPAQGTGTGSSRVSWSAAIVGFGVFVLMWL
ncbi:hypothetical protein K505DRAFT_418574 [Melanomma pulvis-pyrius CBS 109.77]|uniref:Uncharacterized protein n=1 Tax=Melanomma pulvis-pyrius CBS 109.77 TaxID=1314802 RepID=A0A6A6X7K6_9PLEO|nr:hypothetical protein K505DRAFT_418574 [Melanomma pulvis-pyrius CBS 109.77]